MPLDPGKAFHVTGRYYPRGIASSAPIARPGRPLFPRGQFGAPETPTELPEPLYYWRFGENSPPPYTDEMGILDLDQATNVITNGSGADPAGSCLLPYGQNTLGSAWRQSYGGAEADLLHVLMSCWVRKGTAQSTVYVRGSASGSPGTIHWYVYPAAQSESAIPGGIGEPWHHTLFSFRDDGHGTVRAYRRLDGGAETEAAGVITTPTLVCPGVNVANSGAIDELCFLDLGRDVTDADAEDVAAMLFDGENPASASEGHGMFYVSGDGWGAL